MQNGGYSRGSRKGFSTTAHVVCVTPPSASSWPKTAAGTPFASLRWTATSFAPPSPRRSVPGLAKPWWCRQPMERSSLGRVPFCISCGGWAASGGCWRACSPSSRVHCLIASMMASPGAVTGCFGGLPTFARSCLRTCAGDLTFERASVTLNGRLSHGGNSAAEPL